MAVPKHLSLGGKTWQFSRRVPQDADGIVGFQFWRCSPETDSLAKAERRLHVKMVETDEIIQAVRNGTYQRIDDETLDDFAVQWSIWYEAAAAWTLPEPVFGQRFPPVFGHLGKPLSGEISEPVLRSRDALVVLIDRFISEQGIQISRNSPEWDKLVDLCQDEYASSDKEIMNSRHLGSIGPVLKPTKTCWKHPDRRRGKNGGAKVCHGSGGIGLLRAV